MKKALALLFSMLLAGSFACAAPSVGLPNPVVEVSGASAFEGIAPRIDAPEGAQNARYSIISDRVAQVRFELDGRAYTYRAANAAEDISGVYETFDETELGVEADGADWYASIRVRTVRGGKGGALATWGYGAAQYSLSTADAVDANALGELAVRLAAQVCPRPEATPSPDPAFDLRADVSEPVKAALYAYFRGVRHDAEWFDARAAEGVKICVYAARSYRAGTLALADFYLGGELAPDLYYIEDGVVQSATTGSDCWAINYTRMGGDAIVYGKSFAWDGAPMATTHATAVFSDGTIETVELAGLKGGEQPGFLFVCENEVWLHTLTLYDGETVAADQDCGAFTMAEAGDRFAENAPLCRWTRFNPMLDGAARERRLLDAASSIMEIAHVGDEGTGLLRWYKDSGAAFPDLWRTLNNGLPVTVGSGLPVQLDGLNRSDAKALYWVELKLDDGTPAGAEDAARLAGTDGFDSLSGNEPAEAVWATPGAPGHYGLYVLVLDYGACWYTALFNVQEKAA